MLERYANALGKHIEVSIRDKGGKLAEQILNDSYGIENMVVKYLAEDLIEKDAKLLMCRETISALKIWDKVIIWKIILKI